MENMLIQIERGKRMLRLVARQYGLASKEALRYSKHLDKMIVRYQKEMLQKELQLLRKG